MVPVAPAGDPDAVRGMIRLMRQSLAGLSAPPVPRGFGAVRTLPEGLLAVVLRRFFRSRTAAYSGLDSASPAVTAELERVAEQLHSPTR